MKIRAIDIQNFQIHKRTRIPVSDFTMLVGQSSAGKTSVFRALQFLFYGEWDSTYPNDPEKATAVAIELEDGTKIIRIRKGSASSAAIATNTPKGAEVTKFKSFGAFIPGIFNMLNVRPIAIGSKEVNLNFSMQDDPTFMLSESKPAKAQWLGRLYGAHIVNDMLRCMAKDKKDLESRKRVTEENLAKLKKELVEYSSIEEQESALVECKNLIGTAKKIKDIFDAYDMVHNERKSIKRDEWVLGIDLNDIKANVESYKLMKTLKHVKDELDEDRDFIEKNKEALSLKPARMREALSLLQFLTKLGTDLKSVKEKLAKMNADKEMVASKLMIYKKTFGQSLLSGGVCPVCGQDTSGVDDVCMAEGVKRLVGK